MSWRTRAGSRTVTCSVRSASALGQLEEWVFLLRYLTAQLCARYLGPVLASAPYLTSGV